MEAEVFVSSVTDERKQLLEIRDDQFFKLKAVFLAKGRGRRPDLQTLLPTNHLLLQILTLMEDGGKSYSDAASFLHKLYPEPKMETLRHHLSYAKTKWEKKKKHGVSEQQLFLSEQFDVSGVGPCLRKLSLTRTKVLHCLSSNDYVAAAVPSHGLLLDLEAFRNKEGASVQTGLLWWNRLTGLHLSVVNYKSVCKKITTEKERFRKKKKTAQLESFLSSATCFHCLKTTDQTLPPCQDSLPLACPPQSSLPITTQEPAPPISHDLVPLRPTQCNIMNSKVLQQGRQLAAMRRQLEDARGEINELKEKLGCAVQHLQSTSSELLELKEDRSRQHAAVSALKERSDSLVNENTSMKTRLNYYSKGVCKRQLLLQKAKCSKLAEKVKELRKMNTGLQKEQENLRQELRRLQVKNASLTRKLKKAKEKLAAKEEEASQTHSDSGRESVLRLNLDEKGHFTQDAIVCITQND